MQQMVRGLMLAFSLLVSSFVLLAQEGELVLKGVVTESSGAPLAGVNVRVAKSKAAAVTDLNGRYELRGLWKQGAEIRFSFVGMKNHTHIYQKEKVLNVVLEEETNALKEVVVVAKRNINELDIRAKSGVVEAVDVRRIAQKPMMNIALALQGSTPGVVITNTGDVGSKAQIRIRGTSSFRSGDAANEPLYVLDGKVITPEAFAALNPMDISDIKVLKDAVGTALYGIKAANGVIEVTSARGNESGQLSIAYNANTGITLRGSRGIRLMKTAEKLELERLLRHSATPGYRYSEDYFRRYYSADPRLEQLIAEGKSYLDSLRQIDTDWFSLLIRNNMYQSHGVSLRGGSDRSSYYISSNYSYQGGRIQGNDSRRFSSRLSLDQKLWHWGYFSLSAEAGWGRVRTPNGSSYSPVSLLYALNPYETPTSPLTSFVDRGSGITLDDLMKEYQSSSDEKRGGISASVNLNPWECLSFDAVAGIDYALTEGLSFVPSTAYQERYAAPLERGKISKEKGGTLSYTFNARLTFNQAWGDHDVTLGANSDYYYYDLDQISITGYGVGTQKSPSAINSSITGSRKPSVGSLLDRSAQLGVGLVGGYSYRGLYDLFATCKWDASSILPKDKRWNRAWAVGLGWTPTQYAPLSQSKWLRRLNIRTSIGQTANLSGVSAASTIGTFAYSNDFYAGRRLFALEEFYNTDLKAEQTLTLDAGFSMDLWNVFSLGTNLYRRETSQALLDVPIPLSNGWGTMKRNIGVLRNDGVEVTASCRLYSDKDWQVSLRGNIAYNRNKVVSLYFTDKLYTSEESVLPEYEVGKSYDMIYGLHSLGIDPITGLPVFRGADGREISALETPKRENLIPLGHGTPPYTGSMSASISYKQLDLNADFYFVWGGIKAFSTSYIRRADNANKNAISGQVDKMWFKRGDEGKVYYSPFHSSSALAALTLYPNTQTVGKSDFFRLSMLSLRYRVPSVWLQRHLSVVRYASLSLQASNLFTLTPYPESDPESGSTAGTLQPIISFNLNLTF